MAEVAAGFLGPAIEVVRWMGAPILRQFNYLCCFTTNITNLKNEAEKLQDTERDLQGKVDAARNDVRLISCEVETWLRNSKEIKDEKDGIIDEVPNVEGGCLKLRARFSLSRRAKKTTDRLKELRDQCKFNTDAISRPRPPAATEVVPSERAYNFDSRKSIEENIMTMLKDDMDVSIWKDALRQLKQCNPDIPDFIANVYNPLKLSYDFLGSNHKYVFLLCCLYPEDDDIPLEHLTYFCVGLRIFEEGIGNVEEARNRMRALTKVLKSRSLLLDSKKRDDHVRMHDVVRDVCIFIAKQEGYIGDNDCSWLSSSHRSELPMGLAFPNLRLLFFRAHEYPRGKFTLENSFLEGIRDLSVICIERYSLVPLSHTTQMLRNLNALLLHSCRRVETLSVVGELVNLEILICRHCYLIEELPPEIKGLNRLKVLELTGCENLQRIGRDIISSLVGLEELKMLKSFNKWEAEDREEKENAGLKEVETLSKLRSLEIEIEDLALATENIRLSSKVDRFTIRFKCESGSLQSFFDKYLAKQKMRLNWDGTTCLGHWIEMQLLKETEFLLLIGNGANNVDLTKLEKIRCLELGRCESMKKVVTTSMDDGGGATVFPSIDHLMLFELPKLEEIWDRRVSLNCFQILKELKLDRLPALKQLWKSNQNDVGKDFLPRLEVLEIRSCETMEAVFLWEGDSGNENNSCYPITKSFPKLKELQLYELPNLISLCQGIEGIEFPLLRELDIRICVEMKGMVSNENNWGGSSSNASIHGLFCPQQVGTLFIHFSFCISYNLFSIL